MSSQQEQVEAILGQLQFIAWNDGVDFGKGIGGKADDIDKAIGEATQAITALIQEATDRQHNETFVGTVELAITLLNQEGRPLTEPQDRILRHWIEDTANNLDQLNSGDK